MLFVFVYIHLVCAPLACNSQFCSSQSTTVKTINFLFNFSYCTYTNTHSHNLFALSTCRILYWCISYYLYSTCIWLIRVNSGFHPHATCNMQPFETRLQHKLKLFLVSAAAVAVVDVQVAIPERFAFVSHFVGLSFACHRLRVKDNKPVFLFTLAAGNAARVWAMLLGTLAGFLFNICLRCSAQAFGPASC